MMGGGGAMPRLSLVSLSIHSRVPIGYTAVLSGKGPPALRALLHLTTATTNERAPVVETCVPLGQRAVYSHYSGTARVTS
jgi:hypothetical protein